MTASIADGPMTDLAQARVFLRDTLASAAQSAAPHAEAELVDDIGPVRLGSMFDLTPTMMACSLTVQIHDRVILQDPTSAILRAAEHLVGQGWRVRTEVDHGHHRLVAERDGYQIAGHVYERRDVAVFTGQTPTRPVTDREPRQIH